MKLGFNEATCMKNSTLEQDLELLEKHGYDYIEIRLDMLADYLKNHTLDDLKDFFDTHHLKPYGFNSIENINFCGPVGWKALVDLVSFACQASTVIGGKCLVVVPTMGPTMKDRTTDEVFQDSVDVLRRLSGLVEPYGMRLAFEPIGDPRWCVRTVEEALRIVEEVGRENVGLAIDAFNLFMYSRLADIDSLDQVPGEKVFVLHIDDADDLPLGVLDHSHRTFPGNGVIPLAALVHKLKARGYDDICSLELFNPGYWELAAEDVIRIGADKTRAFL